LPWHNVDDGEAAVVVGFTAELVVIWLGDDVGGDGFTLVLGELDEAEDFGEGEVLVGAVLDTVPLDLELLTVLDEAEEPGEGEVLLGDAVLDAVPFDVALLLVCEAVAK
jgi:hypothetical protein